MTMVAKIHLQYRDYRAANALNYLFLYFSYVF
jgi:hypothetical protein